MRWHSVQWNCFVLFFFLSASLISKKLLYLTKVLHGVSPTCSTAQSLCNTSWNWRRCFARCFLPPVDEQRNVRRKWNIRAALVWFTIAACSLSCSWLCFLRSRRKLRQAFVNVCVKVWIATAASKPSLSSVLMLCFCCTAPWLRFQLLPASYRLASVIA